jgi:molybdopterin molybdotransferase
MVERFQARDDEEAIREVLRDCLDRFDVVITSGGVSVGDYDLVRPVLDSLGVEERFWRVAMRPGKPFYFGRKPGGALAFGLPGNPGSAIVTFLIFVKPLLLRLFGLEPSSFYVETDWDIEPSPNVDNFMRVTLSDGIASPVEKQGSNMISSVMLADAVIQVPRGSLRLPKGTKFRAIPVDWTLPKPTRRPT